MIYPGCGAGNCPSAFGWACPPASPRSGGGAQPIGECRCRGGRVTVTSPSPDFPLQALRDHSFGLKCWVLGQTAGHVSKCRERGTDRQKGCQRGGQRCNSSFSTGLPQGCSTSFLLQPQSQHFTLSPGCFSAKERENSAPGCCSLKPQTPRRFLVQPPTDWGVQDRNSLCCAPCPSRKVPHPVEVFSIMSAPPPLETCLETA